MSDDETPQASSPSQPSSAADDQAARIEQLLMAGLDEYFAGRHDRAVQVWSRVFFLDRTNARARAYIERARGAVAERQRLAEAAVAAGEGEASRAGRDDDGRASVADLRGPGLEPEGLLVVSGALAARLAPPVPVEVDVPAAPAAASRRARIAHVLLVAAAGVLLFVAGYTVAARDRLAEWVSGVSVRPGAVVEVPVHASEIVLNEARQALAARRYDDVRRALARIPAGDPLRRQADALAAELQRVWPVVSPMLAPDVPAVSAPSLTPAVAGEAPAPGRAGTR
jgi:hypothetical protein